MTLPIADFPKLYSPFHRDLRDNDPKKKKSRLTSEIEPGFEWIFEQGVRAVDKLHGTNICVTFSQGHVVSIDNRKNRILDDPIQIRLTHSKDASRMLAGVMNGLERGFILNASGRVYGELIGPTYNDNIHLAPCPIFVPFDYLKEHCHWHSWLDNKYPKTFESISDWFKDLPSLFTKQKFGKEVMAEGLVFYHPDGRMAKLRRDMFDWYKGKGHKE
jgi:RNA ligase